MESYAIALPEKPLSQPTRLTTDLGLLYKVSDSKFSDSKMAEIDA
jgi:hypothetical protein